MTDFDKSWRDFCNSGDFLSFTRMWERDEIPIRTQKLKNDTQLNLLDVGILTITPSRPSNIYLIISSGVHGNETAPIEIINQMIKDILIEKLLVKVNLMLMIGNPPAMNISQRFESQNLNRLFSGKYLESKSSDYETLRAENIEKAVTDFYQKSDNNRTKNKRFHFDLHTAIRESQYEKFVVYPFLHNKPWDKDHIAFFGGADISVVLLGNQPAGTFSYYTSNEFGAMSATVELGKVLPFGENEMFKFVGIDRNLRCLIEEKSPVKVSFNNCDYKVFQVKGEILKRNSHFNLNLSDDVKNFTSFEKGFELATDGKNEKYIVEKDGEAIVFPNNNVPVGQRIGVLLEEIEL